MTLRHVLSAAVLALAACATSDQQTGSAPPTPPAHQFAGPPLSSDGFEGRPPGSRGEERTIAYLQRAFAAAGLQPGVTAPDGARSWVQDVPLTSATLTNTPTLTLTGRDGAREY